MEEKISIRVDRQVSKWLGRVARMSEEPMTIKGLESISEAGGAVGRLCTRWWDEVEKACSVSSLNREQWRELVNDTIRGMLVQGVEKLSLVVKPWKIKVHCMNKRRYQVSA